MIAASSPESEKDLADSLYPAPNQSTCLHGQDQEFGPGSVWLSRIISACLEVGAKPAAVSKPAAGTGRSNHPTSPQGLLAFLLESSPHRQEQFPLILSRCFTRTGGYCVIAATEKIRAGYRLPPRLRQRLAASRDLRQPRHLALIGPPPPPSGGACWALGGHRAWCQ
jgi:hypothetical protein